MENQNISDSLEGKNNNEEQNKNKLKMTTIFRPSNVVIFIVALIIIGSYSLLEAIIIGFQRPDLGIYFLISMFLLAAFRLFTVTTLFLKKKIGWILLMFTALIVIAKTIHEDIISIFWKNENIFSYPLMENLKYYSTKLIIPLGIVLYLNKGELLKLFNVNKKTQKITLIICIIIATGIIINAIFIYNHLH